MNAVNYQKQLEETLARIDAGDHVPTLLLHACCAPCSSYVLTVLAEHFRVTICFYNPNITDEAEFTKRADELRRLVSELPVKYPVSVVVPEYKPEEFYEIAKGLEQEPERGKRCEACFRLRLNYAARMAAETEAEYFATTLTISPQKDAALLNQIGAEAEALIAAESAENDEKYGDNGSGGTSGNECNQGTPVYLASDFKKKGGYAESVRLSEVYGLYRQNYCGCAFSKRDAMLREARNGAGRAETSEQ
ncbi:MAG: epoxyqueuosine reductase QueH [Lachnospiraceae bacterium]|nr:epoxyqueuosine reductase QueH [Lachnospiraceae bacterium]